MSDDIRDDADFQTWEKHVRENVIPKMEASALTISLVPNGKPDIKYAVELGLSIMLGKPIFIVCAPDQELPPKLMLIADKIIEVDWRSDAAATQSAIADAIQDFFEEHGDV